MVEPWKRDRRSVRAQERDAQATRHAPLASGLKNRMHPTEFTSINSLRSATALDNKIHSLLPCAFDEPNLSETVSRTHQRYGDFRRVP